MEKVKKLKGYIVLSYCDDNSIFVSKLNKVYKYYILEDKIEEVYVFPRNTKHLISKISYKARRLLRSDIRFALKYNFNHLLLVHDSFFLLLDLEAKKISHKVKLPKGSRPLNMSFIKNIKGFNNGLYYGEYFINPLKKEADIYRYEKSKLTKVYCFPTDSINHIHNLIPDVYNNCVWILTGDFGKGAAIYKATDNFKNVELVLENSQQYRSCVAFATPQGLLYATDSQFEQNHIRLLKFNEISGWYSEIIYPINGPSIFGTNLKEQYVFSTSVEAINKGSRLQKYLRRRRGPGVIKNQSEIVIGNLESGFKTEYTNKKDFFPFVLFQFGNILFPTGKNTTQKLCFTNVALQKNDLTTFISNI